MKQFISISFTILLITVLGACGSTKDNKQNEPINDNPNGSIETDNTDANTEQHQDNQADNTEEDGTTSTDDEQTYMKEKMDELPFLEFEVEVDYQDNTDFSAEIELKSTGMVKAELEDELNQRLIRGRQAFDEIYPIAEKLNITQDSDKDEVINQVVELFDLPDNYTEIEVKVVLHDGNIIKFEIEK